MVEQPTAPCDDHARIKERTRGLSQRCIPSSLGTERVEGRGKTVDPWSDPNRADTGHKGSGLHLLLSTRSILGGEYNSFILKKKDAESSWRIVQAESRYLAEAESRYAMIELECLGAA